MNSDKKFDYFSYLKGLIELITLFLLVCSIDKGPIYLILSIILSIILISLPNLKYKFDTTKEYWKANTKAVLPFLVISLIVFMFLATFAGEYDAFGFFIIVLVFGIFYIPIFLITSFAIDIVLFKIRENKNSNKKEG